MNNIFSRFNPAQRCRSLINKQSIRKCQIYKYDPEKEGDIIENYQFSIMTIGINLPETRNELDENSMEKIIQLVDKYENDDNIRGAVIHGIGGNFCKGISLPPNKNQDDYIEKFKKLKKPIFAAVSGYATGFGFALASMCDFRIVETNCLIGIGSNREEFSPFPNVAAERIASCIGYSHALEFILTKRLFACHEAVQSHWAISQTDVGTALGQCVIEARCIGKFPMKQTVMDKELLFSHCFERSRS